MIVRPMTAADIGRVTEIHLAAFPRFFLSFLGPRFLRLLYRSILEDSSGVALVAAENDAVIGFVAGVKQQRGFYQRLVSQHAVEFALASSIAAVRKPSIIPRLFRALKRPEESGHAASPASLMSLGVHPDHHGRSAGAALVSRFCDHLKSGGAATVSLTTDRDDNDDVNRFYQRSGFRVVRQYTTPEGRAMNEYLRDL
jgi:ribosomal protein S18 acetylase RimI-like enzyme